MQSIDYLGRVEIDQRGCWNYTGTINRAGYGQIRQTTAHRFFWLAIKGPIPDGLQLDHVCLNKRCVNPDHLEPVTNAENQRRRAARVTACVNGHAYTDENTIVKANGTRNCRRCQNAAMRAWREARKGSPLAGRGRPRKAA